MNSAKSMAIRIRFNGQARAAFRRAPRIADGDGSVRQPNLVAAEPGLGMAIVGGNVLGARSQGGGAPSRVVGARLDRVGVGAGAYNKARPDRGGDPRRVRGLV